MFWSDSCDRIRRGRRDVGGTGSRFAGSRCAALDCPVGPRPDDELEGARFRVISRALSKVHVFLRELTRYRDRDQMADKSLPADHLPSVESLTAPRETDSSVDRSERRAFLRRAALIGIPVVVASIPGRRVWAQPSRPAGGNQGGLKKPGGAQVTPQTTLTAGCLASGIPGSTSGCANRSQSLL